MDLDEILRVDGFRDIDELINFEPDPDHTPDAGTGKSEIESQSNRHLTQSRLQVTGCTVERYCLLHIVVQGPASFRGLLNFFVRRTVAELWGVKLSQFSEFGLCRRYMHFTECPVDSFINMF